MCIHELSQAKNYQKLGAAIEQVTLNLESHDVQARGLAATGTRQAKSDLITFNDGRARMRRSLKEMERMYERINTE